MAPAFLGNGGVMNKHTNWSGVIIGGSLGGFQAVETALKPLPADYGLPLLLVLHVANSPLNSTAELLDKSVNLQVMEAEDKQHISSGHVYIAPAGYHLLLERNGSLALDAGERDNYVRPSIDALFETAAWAWGSRVIAVLLSGSNNDGADGLRQVHSHGGVTIAQDPATAEAPIMPQSAISLGVVDKVLSPEDIGNVLAGL
jgi:two-component system chemotaxis response regulator CheB